MKDKTGFFSNLKKKLALLAKNRWVSFGMCRKCRCGLLGRCFADGCSFRYDRDRARSLQASPTPL